MIDVAGLLAQYGLPIVFFGSILEGESVVVLAAYATRQELIDGIGGLSPLAAMFILAMLGSFLGDQIYFWIGRYWGKPYLAKRPALDKKIARLHGIVTKYESTIMFGSRFMYGFRVALPVSLGLSKANPWKYAMLNILGSITWASIWTSLGWYAYDFVENFFQHAKKFEHTFERTVVIGLILGVIISQGIVFMRRKIEEKVEEVEEEIEGGQVG